MSRASVGVNLLWLVPDDVGGSEEYAVRVLTGVAGHAPEDLVVTLFALPAFTRAYPDLVARFRTIVAPVKGRRRLNRIIAESTWLAAQARRHHLDLVHHMGGTVPLLRGAPALVTVHDLQPILHPETFSPAKARYLRAMLPWSVGKARRINAVSQFTADGIIERLDVTADRVDVVPHGIDPATARPSATAIEEVRRRYQLKPRWFVYPSVTYPYKNHLRLVEAFARVAEAETDVSLVLTGRADSAEPPLLDAIERLGLVDRVRRTGRIPRPDVDALIAGAVALVLPSTFEGFGAPALEAMALSTPVVAAKAASLPEVVGDAGLLADPLSPDEWFRAMSLLLHNEPERGRLARAGFERSTQYGWDSAATAQVDSWRKAIGART